MNRKYGWAIIVVSVFMISTYLLVSKIQDSRILIPVTKTKEIIYGVNGYIPKEAFIKKGDTITFNNLGKSSMWPASANHPTHEIYPEFDAKKPIPQKSTYSFTFTKPGVWNYHDHLESSKTGTVTVK